MANDPREKLAVGGDVFIRENPISRGYNAESIAVDNSDDVTGILAVAELPAGYPLAADGKPVRHVGGTPVYFLLEPLKIAAGEISQPVAVATGKGATVTSVRDLPDIYSAAADGTKQPFSAGYLVTMRNLGFVDRSAPLQFEGPQVK